MTNLIFVCYGNICRSPMAEVVMTEKVRQAGLSDEFTIISRASDPYDVGMEVDHRAISALLQAGYNPQASLSKHISELISDKDLQIADWVYCMDRDNILSIEKRFPAQYLDKVSLLAKREILDPWYNGRFLECLQEIEGAIDCLISELIRPVKA